MQLFGSPPGGGLGSTRKGGADVNSRFSGRDEGGGGGDRDKSSPDRRYVLLSQLMTCSFFHNLYLEPFYFDFLGSFDSQITRASIILTSFFRLQITSPK